MVPAATDHAVHYKLSELLQIAPVCGMLARDVPDRWCTAPCVAARACKRSVKKHCGAVPPGRIIECLRCGLLLGLASGQACRACFRAGPWYVTVLAPR